MLTILEISRILKDDGIACIRAPSLVKEHRYPVDCWRIYPEGVKVLAKYSGLNTSQLYAEVKNSLSLRILRLLPKKLQLI